MSSLAWLGSYQFNIEPESVSWNFSANVSEKHTVGGKVVQVLGLQYSDLEVSGSFGNSRMTPSGEMIGGWEEQERFLQSMGQQSESYVQNPAQPALKFIYPQKQWSFDVRIKKYQSGNGGRRSVRISADVANPRWNLTLHVVRDNAGLKTRAIDKYIERLSNGMGWRATEFQGPYSEQDFFANIAGTIRPGESTQDWLSRVYAEGQGIIAQGNLSDATRQTVGDLPGQAGTPGSVDGESPTIWGSATIPLRRAQENAARRTSVKRIPQLGNLPVEDVVAAYYTVGQRENIRPDFAFAQAVIETGNFAGNSEVRYYNFAGIAHYNGQARGSRFGSLEEGVVAHIQLLKFFALGNDAPTAYPRTAINSFARAERWHQLAGTWAVPGTGYWANIRSVYRELGGTVV